MRIGKGQAEQGQPPKGKRRSGLSKRTVNLSNHEDLSMRFINSSGVVLFHLEFIRSLAKPRATISTYDKAGEMIESLTLPGLDA